MIVTMISCRQNHDRRAATIESLKRAAPWLKVDLFIDSCDIEFRVNRIAREVLDYGIRRESDILFLEDDLEFSPIGFPYLLGLYRGMRMRAKAPLVAYFYLHESDWNTKAWYGVELANRLATNTATPGLYPLRARHLYGSQCVTVPYQIQSHILEHLARNDTATFDYTIGNLRLPEVQFWAALPNPVQHVGVRNNRHDPRPYRKRRSISYEQWGRMGVAQDQGTPSESPDETPPA